MKLLFQLAGAAATMAALVVYPVPELSLDWTAMDSDVLSTDEIVSFTFAVREQNTEKVRAIAEQVSDPKSPSYGDYLSSEEILEMTKPAKKDLVVVCQWLKDAGIKHRILNHKNVRVEASVKDANTLLSTEFRTLVNAQSEKKVIRAGAYSLPEEVSEVVAAIFGLHGLPLPAAKPLTATDGDPASVTPDVIAQTYSIAGVKPSGSATNRQAVAEFQGQYEKDTDLAYFFQNYVPTAQPGDEKVTLFVGDKDRQEAGIEASLDIQYIMGVAPHIQTEFWLFSGNDFCKDLKEWTDKMLADDNCPLVTSVSYGWQGKLSQLGCMTSEITYVDNNFAKLAAKGITVIFASGDSGSGYQPQAGNVLYPSWPASSPWVTAVGATRFVGQQVGNAEMATDQFGSGGGFSDMFKQADNAKWQMDAVKHYVDNPPNDPHYPTGMFDPLGRATPDVSALGEGYQVVANNRVMAVGGTSASAPAFAGMVSLLNEARAQANMKPLGFLNPFLYLNAAAFNDVTLGTNAYGRGNGPIKYGFNATAGWDPATGLGTPNFKLLLAAATK